MSNALLKEVVLLSLWSLEKDGGLIKAKRKKKNRSAFVFQDLERVTGIKGYGN